MARGAREPGPWRGGPRFWARCLQPSVTRWCLNELECQVILGQDSSRFCQFFTFWGENGRDERKIMIRARADFGSTSNRSLFSRFANPESADRIIEINSRRSSRIIQDIRVASGCNGTVERKSEMSFLFLWILKQDRYNLMIVISRRSSHFFDLNPWFSLCDSWSMINRSLQILTDS